MSMRQVKKSPQQKPKQVSRQVKVKKTLTSFRPRVRSRHPSHNPLRQQLPLLPFRSIVRLGSTTEEDDGHRLVECNSVQAIQNSANKRLMKMAFDRGHVKTARWGRAAAIVEHLAPLEF